MAEKEKKSLSYLQKYWIAEICGFLASIGVPVGTALVMFPPEILTETKMSVGLSVIITLVVAVSVLRKQLAEQITNIGPTVTYAIIAGVCLLTRYLADQLLVVSIVGVIANAGSIPLFKIAEKNKEKNELLKKAQIEKEITEKVG